MAGNLDLFSKREQSSPLSHMIFFKMTRTHSEWSILLGGSSQTPKPIFVLCQAWLRVQSVLRKYKITKRMRGKLNPHNHGSKMDHWESIPPMTLHTSLYSVSSIWLFSNFWELQVPGTILYQESGPSKSSFPKKNRVRGFVLSSLICTQFQHTGKNGPSARL